ncbi:MAG: CDGSH iron-sulfur domain-containing protein [Methyloligellaceae bacterium]
MKTKIHAAAGVIAFLTILSFWTSTVYTELFTSHETIAWVKGLILKGMFILIPAMIIVGGSGMSLGAKRQDDPALRKKKRMPIIALTGLLVLLPAAFYLEMKASTGQFDMWFYSIQLVELIAGGSNLTLMFLNIRDGLTMTGRIGHMPPTLNDISLKVQKNGPVFLAGEVLVEANGRPLTLNKTTALCRCGASKRKPFCDGSHNDINFDDSVSSDRTDDELKVYKGDAIDVHYNKLLCSHASICGSQLPEVFNSNSTQWINPDKGEKEAIKRVIQKCPSGALSFSEPNGIHQHLFSNEHKITIEKNGPYLISGIALKDIVAAKGSCSDKYALCRCGASKNKPFCDGSHVDIGWQDA